MYIIFTVRPLVVRVFLQIHMPDLSWSSVGQTTTTNNLFYGLTSGIYLLDLYVALLWWIWMSDLYAGVIWPMNVLDLFNCLETFYNCMRCRCAIWRRLHARLPLTRHLRTRATCHAWSVLHIREQLKFVPNSCKLWTLNQKRVGVTPQHATQN